MMEEWWIKVFFKPASKASSWEGPIWKIPLLNRLFFFLAALIQHQRISVGS